MQIECIGLSSKQTCEHRLFYRFPGVKYSAGFDITSLHRVFRSLLFSRSTCLQTFIFKYTARGEWFMEKLHGSFESAYVKLFYQSNGVTYTKTHVYMYYAKTTYTKAYQKFFLCFGEPCESQETLRFNSFIEISKKVQSKWTKNMKP